MGSQDFPDGSVVRESACQAGDGGLIPGLGRSSGERNGKLLQYPCLENPFIEESGGLQSIALDRTEQLNGTEHQYSAFVSDVSS